MISMVLQHCLSVTSTLSGKCASLALVRDAGGKAGGSLEALQPSDLLGEGSLVL